MNNERAKIDKSERKTYFEWIIVELKFWLYKCTIIDKNK